MTCCNLCNNNYDLQDSHIIPGFLFNWLIKTSATGFIRSAEQPNRRIQDGWKFPLLCGNCETIFNNWETHFANKIFYKFIHESQRNHLYDEWLLRFCVSVSWRALKYIVHIEKLKNFGETTIENVNFYIDKWRKYLHGDQTYSAYELNHHLYFTEELSEAHEDGHVFINRYLQRAIEIDLISSDEEEFVYVKFPYFILIGFFGEQGKEKNWKGAEVHKKGELKPSCYYMPRYFWSLIKRKCDTVVKMRHSYSARQISKIYKTIEQNPAQYDGSLAKNAFKKDFELFGVSAIVDKGKP